MKTILSFTALLFLFISGASAQKATDKAIKQSCDCLAKLDLTQDPKTLETAGSKCIESTITSNIAGLIKDFKLDMNDDDAAKKLGERLGMELVKRCPAFLEYVQKIPDDDDETTNEQFQEGKVISIAKDSYFTVTIEDKSGDKRIFYLIDYFTGSEEIVKSKDDLKNKMVKIGYTPKMIFDIESNEFKERKIITSVTL